MSTLFVGSYLLLLGLLACYGLYRYYLVWLYYRGGVRRAPRPPPPSDWPRVTVQIPVYNERYVVERAIRSACEVDYPADRLDIQILDDSTDETSDIIARAVARARRQGLAVSHLRRRHRTHFKAGALAAALRRARGEFLAVFDVDFIIPRDFFRRSVPYFADPSVGVVQARWGYVNADDSLLTQAQAVLLDGHFALEQVARSKASRFINFNGTAGVWRRRALQEAGGWQADTLTEDLDLSFRAQLAGWRGVYLEDLVAPAELPIEMNAFKTQQYRWTKGTIQTAKKLLPAILRSRLPWWMKLDLFFHLTSYLSYPLGVLASLCLPPLLMGVWRLPHSWYMDAVWCVLLAVPGVCFYCCAQRATGPRWSARLGTILWAVAVGLGLSVTNALAVLDGLWGRTSRFVRTAKFGVRAKTGRWSAADYRTPPSPAVWVELALGAYFAAGFVIALKQDLWLALPSMGLFCVSFAYVAGLSLWQHGRLRTWWWEHVRADATLPEQA